VLDGADDETWGSEDWPMAVDVLACAGPGRWACSSSTFFFLVPVFSLFSLFLFWKEFNFLVNDSQYEMK
jgi:hypothetical protein